MCTDTKVSIRVDKVVANAGGADKSLARPGRKQAWKQVREACDFNNIKTQAVIKFFFLQGKVLKEIHVILTEILACFNKVICLFDIIKIT